MAGARLIGKIAYGALFVVLLPLAIWRWAIEAETIIVAPPVVLPELGAVLVAFGAILIAWGWYGLWAHAGGLPMNAFPPPRFATRGVYALVGHPIYIGFDLGLFGLAMIVGSAALFWLIAPLITLGSLALLYGYELRSLAERFGEQRERAAIAIPPATGPANLSHRASAYFVLLFPWAVLYESVTRLGPPHRSIETYLELERGWPLVTELYPVYASVYVVALGVPLVLADAAAIRRYVVSGLVACAITFPLYWFLPFVAPPKPLAEGAPFFAMLQLERALDSARAAFPSFHVIFACLAAGALAGRFPSARTAIWLWALLVGVACIAVGMHGVVDVAAGYVVGLMSWRYETTWEKLRALTERIANSWREWTIGPVRVIQHGAYAAAASGGGVFIVLTLLGPSATVPATIAALGGLVCAALWAQWIEGSPSLLRPYGFYGGVLGIVLGALVAPLFGTPTWALLGAYAVAAPWVQAVGRLRCLVQGCCHGSPSSEGVGIHYRHPRSRVVRLSPWAGEPIHPTPLYSILGNAVAALVLYRAWALGLPATFIAGLFLLLNGLARFVEESYRGEGQTPVRGALRLYQWIALACIVGGAVLTAIPSAARGGTLFWSPGALGVAALVGLLVGAALGVDLPKSNARFSRLV
ncbi:MAG: phosphatase PAP2 family protein [Polyangiaceae bacterium]|nr:phosphatase PAP2 family protein [Polyangiaceae bacterium]